MKKKMMGLCTLLITILSVLSFGHFDLNEVNAEIVEENRIVNGDFRKGLDNWGLLHEFDGKADLSVSDQEGATVDILDLGVRIHPEWNIPISWSTQLVQENISIDNGYTYELSFDAFASESRPIEVEFTGLSGVENVKFNLTNDKQTFSHQLDYNFQSTDFTLKFLIGTVIADNGLETPDSEHTLYFDNISFKAIKEVDKSTNDDIDWQLSWSDEFDGNSLNLNNWKYDYGNYMLSDEDEWVPGWGNNESQYYQEDNVYVQDGKLIIEARKESVSDEHDTYDYTSGKIMTKDLFSQTYGRFEARMKLPEGQGFWPAFWLMPQDDVYGGWASSGEIDIMENRGDQTDIVGGAVHYGGSWPNNVHTAGEYHFPDGSSITDFNVYSLEWVPGELRWYVNDELFYKKNDWYSDHGEYPAPFDQDFYVILNLAVGGWYGLEPDENTSFPNQVEVDYVRIYEGEYEPVSPPEEPDDNDSEDENSIVQVNPDDYRSIGESIIVDGDFDMLDTSGLLEGKTAWSIHNQGDFEEWAGLANFEIVDGVLTSKIQQVGWDWWHIQLFQDLSIPSGTYLLSFDAESEIPRNLFVELVNSGHGIVEVELDEEMNSYHYLITFAKDVENSQLLFGLGRKQSDTELEAPYTMLFDNVTLVEVEEIEENDKLAELEKKLKELEQKLKELEQKQNISAKELATLKKELSQLKKEIQTKNIDSDAFRGRISALEARIAQLEKENVIDGNGNQSGHESKENNENQENDLENDVESDSDDELPQTGENHNVNLYIVGLVLIGSGLILSTKLRKKRSN